MLKHPTVKECGGTSPCIFNFGTTFTSMRASRQGRTILGEGVLGTHSIGGSVSPVPGNELWSFSTQVA
jgi:hypothetical protein